MNFSKNVRPFKRKIDELKFFKINIFLGIRIDRMDGNILDDPNVNNTFAMEISNILGLNVSIFMIFFSTGLIFCCFNARTFMLCINA